MKSITLIFLLFISFKSYSQFRNTTWGMNIDEVKKIEQSKLSNSQKPNSLTYTIDVAEAKCDLIYLFKDDQLTKIQYNFRNFDLDREIVNEFSQLWRTTISNLKSKYGNNFTENKGVIVWQNPNFTIKAYTYDPYISKMVIVEYTPPISSQKDLL